MAYLRRDVGDIFAALTDGSTFTVAVGATTMTCKIS
jgi:hypothetical protein